MPTKNFLLCCLILALWAPAADGQTEPIQQLELNLPVAAEIAKDQLQRYRVVARKGDFVRVVVAQKNSDVKLKAARTGGEWSYEVDNSNTRLESEKISFVAEQEGQYQLEISFVRRLPGSVPGEDYEIRLEALRPANERDQLLIRAEQTYDQANRMRFKRDAESRRQALEVFQNAAAFFVQAEDRLAEAFVYYALGQLHSLLTEREAARTSFGRAAQIFRELNALPQYARTITDQAAVFYIERNFNEALARLEEAQKIFGQIGDRRGEAEIIGNFGAVYEALDNPRRALEFYRRALPLLEAENDRAGVGRLLSNIGSVYDDMGEPLSSLEHYEQALKVRREIGDSRTEAYTLVNMSIVLKAMGQFDRAIDANLRACRIFSEIGERYGEAGCQNNLGNIYNDLNDNQKALGYYERVLQINRDIKSRVGEATALNNIGNLALLEDNVPRALELFAQSLELFREAKDKRGEARLLVKLGEARQKLGDHQKALEFFNQARPLFQEIEDRDWAGTTLFRIGDAHRRARDLARAKDHYLQALEIKREVRDSLSESLILFALARTEKDLGNFDESRNRIEKGIEILEDLRKRVSRHDLRASFISSKQDFYEFYVDLLVTLHQTNPTGGYDALALQASERARARNLLESMDESRWNIRSGVSPELLEKEQNLRRTINAKDNLRLNAVRRKQTGLAAEFEKEISALISQFHDIQAEIRRQNPQFAALAYPEPLSLTEIRQQVLDENTVLLEYFLGAERSFLFAATRERLEIFVLPKREVIDNLARPAIESLRARGQVIPGEVSAGTTERLERTDAELEESLTGLSRILLDPVGRKIQNKRLLIIPSGILQYLPFAAFKSPAAGRSRGGFLIETNEIVHLPSASVLPVLRRNREKKTAGALLAILADPVFTADDLRLKALLKQKQNPPLPDPVNTPAVMTQALLFPPQLRSGFARLRFSRLEAEAIAALAPDSQRFVALDFAASPQTFKNEALRQARIVHLATHGIINSDYPELSGVVLSLVDENGQPQDGFLRLHDIYNLHLEADLVVLSACETALGKEIRGEGIVGLTRGFMYAGAPSVVASLWRVEDRATAELMKRFYQKLLRERMPAAGALRAAQISLLNEKSTRHPFFWAGFTLQGDWQPRN